MPNTPARSFGWTRRRRSPVSMETCRGPLAAACGAEPAATAPSPADGEGAGTGSAAAGAEARGTFLWGAICVALCGAIEVCKEADAPSTAKVPETSEERIPMPRDQRGEAVTTRE